MKALSKMGGNVAVTGEVDAERAEVEQEVEISSRGGKYSGVPEETSR